MDAPPAQSPRNGETGVAKRRAAPLVADDARAREEKRQISAKLAHDLRGPLTVMMCNGQHLIERASPDTREVVEEIIAAAKAMHGIVLELLDGERAE